MLKVIQADMEKIIKRHSVLGPLCNRFLEDGFSAAWHQQYESLAVNDTLKAVILRVIFGDPSLCADRPCPDLDRLGLYFDYLSTHPRKLHLPETKTTHRSPPKFMIRAFCDENIKSVRRFLFALAERQDVVQYFEGHVSFNLLMKTFYLDVETIETWFSTTKYQSPLPNYFAKGAIHFSLHNTCLFLTRFLKRPFSGLMQNKIPAHIRDVLGVEKGVPSLLAGLDVLALVLDEVLPLLPETPIGQFALIIKARNEPVFSEFKNAIRRIGWLSDTEVSRFLDVNKNLNSGSRFSSSLLFNKTRSLKVHDHEKPYRTIFQQINSKKILECIKTYHPDLSVEMVLSTCIKLKITSGIGVRDVANIHALVAAAELSAGRDNISKAYSEILPASALWRLGVMDEIAYRAKETKKEKENTSALNVSGKRSSNQRMDTAIESLLFKDIVTIWMPGTAVRAGQTVLVHRAFINAVIWPAGAVVIPYGADKISPDQDPFVFDGELSSAR